MKKALFSFKHSSRIVLSSFLPLKVKSHITEIKAISIDLDARRQNSFQVQFQPSMNVVPLFSLMEIGCILHRFMYLGWFYFYGDNFSPFLSE